MDKSSRDVPDILQYAVKPRTYWMRYRVLVLACCGTVLALAAVAVAPEIAAGWQRFWWQQTWAACAVVPPFRQGAVVFEEGNVTAMPESVGVGMIVKHRGETSAVMHEAPTEVRRVWRALGVYASVGEDPVIFAGRRKDPSGLEFLVVVQLHWQDHRPGFFNDEMPVWSIPATVPPHASRRYRIMAENASNGMVNADGAFRVYAGELDPNDNTHFVIPYAMGNRRGVLDGWVRPTYDEWPPLLLRYRDGPGARTPLDTQDWMPEQTSEAHYGSASTKASATSDRGAGGESVRDAREMGQGSNR